MRNRSTKIITKMKNIKININSQEIKKLMSKK